MQTQALESTFGQPLPPADPQHIQSRHYGQNAPSNSDTTRSRSRSTDGTDNTEASHSATTINEPSVPISQPMQNLGMALQHATLDTQTFTNFNNPDLFSFQPNSLLQYPMLSSFGRNPQMNALVMKGLLAHNTFEPYRSATFQSRAPVHYIHCYDKTKLASPVQTNTNNELSIVQRMPVGYPTQHV